MNATLIPCPACAASVSSAAPTCPCCGHPIAGPQPVRGGLSGIAGPAAQAWSVTMLAKAVFAVAVVVGCVIAVALTH